MVELVGVAEGVHDGLEDRFQNFRVAIYTKSTRKKISNKRNAFSYNWKRKGGGPLRKFPGIFQ